MGSLFNTFHFWWHSGPNKWGMPIFRKGKHTTPDSWWILCILRFCLERYFHKEAFQKSAVLDYKWVVDINVIFLVPVLGIFGTNPCSTFRTKISSTALNGEFNSLLEDKGTRVIQPVLGQVKVLPFCGFSISAWFGDWSITVIQVSEFHCGWTTYFSYGEGEIRDSGWFPRIFKAHSLNVQPSFELFLLVKPLPSWH